MPIDTPSYEEVVGRVRADIANSLPDVDPTIFGSFVNALAVSNAGRHYDNVLLIKQLIKELFPQTASGEFIELWAQYEGLSRIAAQASSGYITVTGTVATSIPALTEWRTANNLVYSSLTTVVIAAQSYSISSLVRSGTTVTGTTSSSHIMATGMDITISGANETEYNGTFTITVLSSTTFSYEITGTPSTPATGTILATFDGASIEVQANTTGTETNIASGGELQVTGTIVGLDPAAFVSILGLTGGGDEETDEALLDRVLYSRANPVANFNESAIILKAKTIPGVTRVFVNRITPYVGAVTVSFMRDNDPDPIPDSGEVTEVKNALLEILPAQSDPNDLVVLAPTPVDVDFTFTVIDPDTATMRQAITDNLTAYFEDQVEYEVDVDEDKYRAVIINTIDTETGDGLETFTLSTPSGDVVISTNEIGVLGVITYP